MRNTSLLRRLGAMIYDALLVAALLFLVTIPFVALRGGEPVQSDSNLGYRLALLAVVFAFFTGFWSGPGRTLGMQSWGLQLETTKGVRASFGQATIRFFAAILSWLPLGLGFLWQLWDKQGLTWHDRMSGTRIVYYPRNDRKS